MSLIFALAKGDFHIGFYPVAHLGIPQAVKTASKSVFQVLVPNFEGHSLNTFKIQSPVTKGHRCANSILRSTDRPHL